jgi:O-antigen/teichoic acid export membrane protein
VTMRQSYSSGRAAAGRVSWGLADQALSSLTNFGLVVLVARSVQPAEFGAFSVVYAMFALALGAARAIAGEPLLIAHSATTVERWRWGVAGACGAALLTGALAGLGCIVAGLFASGPLRGPFVAMGVALPVLLVQDCWRQAFVAEGAPRKAFVNDLVWAIALAVNAALVVLFFPHARTTGVLILAWGTSGGVAAAVGLVQAGVGPAPTKILAWYREHRALIPRYLAECAITNGAGALSSYLLAAIAGLAAAGALRGAAVVMGPVMVLMMGVGLVAVPEGARILRHSARRLGPAFFAYATVLAAGTFTWGLLASSLPNQIGALLLGDNWLPARPLILPVAIAAAGTVLSSGAGMGLRVLAAAQWSLRARMVASPIMIVAIVAGAATAAAEGVAWASAGAQMIVACVWWWCFSRAMRRHSERPAEDGKPHDPHHGEVPCASRSKVS